MLRWLRPQRAGTSKDVAASELPQSVAPPTAVRTAAQPAAPAAVTPIDPALAHKHFELGNQALVQGQMALAEQHLRKALACQPDHVQALCNLGALLKDHDRPQEAETLFERVLARQPRTAAAAFNLGMLRLNQGRWPDAVALLGTAASCQPKDADAQYWLGNARMGWGDASAARKAYQAALRIEPGRMQARWGHAMAQIPPIAKTEAEHAAAPRAFALELGKLTTWFRAQPALDGSAAVGAQQPYYLAYREADHRATLADYGALCVSLMSAWARRAGVPGPTKSAGPKFRIGIVSAHVHSHSVWHALLRGWVEHLDPRRFELHLFHTGSVSDSETQWAARRVARFHHGAGEWKAWVRLVADSKLDAILYPEIGMDATTVRLASLRLARLQLATWGHPITSGLPTIDGYLSAQAFEPPDAEQHYTERLITLPRLGCCYKPYGTAPAQVDFMSFGIGPQDRVMLCAGVPFKYAPRFDHALIDLVRRCGPCKLVFFADTRSNLADQLRERLSVALDAAGLSAAQTLCFVPWQSQAAFFAFLDRADLYVDSLGFSGFNTAMQAVERGTPIVAYEGHFMRGRFASAILRQIGLDEWVADTPERFVECAVRILGDQSARATLRHKMDIAGSALYGDKAGVEDLGRKIAELLTATATVPPSPGV